MDSPSSSFSISLNSTFESVDIAGLVVNQQIENQPNQLGSPSNDDRRALIEKIIQVYVKHPQSLVCLTDWVKVLNTLLEDCEKLPEGKVQLINLFRENQHNLIDIFFFIKCKKCHKGTKVQSDQKKGSKCSNCNELLKTEETNFFVILPVEHQIVQSLETNWNAINKFWTENFEHGDSGTSPKSYTDAYDGNILRKVIDEYKESMLNILPLCINVDGANKFKSNSHSVWPIQLIQNYLPPYMRYLPQNIIVNGLYYHKSKEEEELNFHVYLRPLIDELNSLNKDPISLEIEETQYQFKPVVTSCAIDLPAKSKLQETKQFGGYDACTFCDIPGERVLIEKLKTSSKSCRKSPEKSSAGKPIYGVRYVESDRLCKLRDEVETLEKMLAVSELNGKKPIDGIKDVSCLVCFEHFNIVWSLSVEYMHCVLQGVVKRLLNFFVNPKYSNKEYYVQPAPRKMLNKKILNIRPTSSIVRKARSLQQLAKFKASEYRSMLLYYLPVCLPGSVPNVYVKHVRLLSASVYILLQKSITTDEVDRAERLLVSFVQQHQQLFGKQNMVMVVHLLKHLAQSVRELGPLWCHSAFSFERNNGCLLKLVSGTTDVLQQISSKYCLSKSVNNQDGHMKADVNTTEVILLGKAVDIEESTPDIFDTLSMEDVNFENVLSVHKRIKFKNVIYTSTLYTRPKRSIDYFIGLTDGVIGKAKYFFTYKNVKCVMLEEYEIIEKIDHINKVLNTKQLLIARIDEIEKKYIFMNVGLNNYIVSRPNPYENE